MQRSPVKVYNNVASGAYRNVEHREAQFLTMYVAHVQLKAGLSEFYVEAHNEHDAVDVAIGALYRDYGEGYVLRVEERHRIYE